MNILIMDKNRARMVRTVANKVTAHVTSAVIDATEWVWYVAKEPNCIFNWT
jgi:hypothetical protein